MVPFCYFSAPLIAHALKILSAAQIREADAYTIAHEPIKSIDLMERAAGKCFDWLYENAPRLFPPTLMEESAWLFHVYCGVGNNGGDGLVIARMLQRSGYEVALTVVRFSEKVSPDFEANYAKLGPLKKALTEVTDAAQLPPIDPNAVVIDALLGTGLSRPADGLSAQAIDHINASGAVVVSIDVPSGLFCDSHTHTAQITAIRAHHVLTFQSPKLSFFLAEYAPFIGQVHVLPIGLHAGYMDTVETTFELVDSPFAARLRRPRQRFAHKGTHGHALLIGGSAGKWGAITLAAMGCMRAGVGLLTVHCGAQGHSTLLHHLPEAMLSTDDAGHFGYLPPLEGYKAIGVGPGMGRHEESARALKLLIQECRVPLVLDADALNILAENLTWLSFLPQGTVLTPHPGEWARLAGGPMRHSEALELQREWSRKYGIYILLKGAHSSLSTPQGKVYINLTGNAGMATAGMGDALTGIITGLLAQGYGPAEAAALGMYVHGKAGDLAPQSPESLLASDVIACLGAAFNSLTPHA
jgi:NAD(P)H-hydrate epimerase